MYFKHYNVVFPLIIRESNLYSTEISILEVLESFECALLTFVFSVRCSGNGMIS